MEKKLVYVTGNEGKFKEAQLFFRRYAPGLMLAQLPLDIQEIQSMDQEEVAVDKAKKAWTQVGKPLLMNDGGIFFERYNQFPGILSKFVMQGLGFEGVKKLIQPGDRAFFRMCLVYIDGDNSYKTFEGKCEGTLITPPLSDAINSLPYDSIFIPDGASETYAALRARGEVDEYSYHMRALRKFLAWFHTYQ